MNVFAFTGNLGKDAEMRTTQSGTSVLSFSVAVKSGYGEREKTNWVRCVIFGKRAEGNLQSYLVKGQQVAVHGELTLEEWQDQQGQNKAALSVNVNGVTLVGSKAAPVAPQQAPAQPQGFQQAPQQAPQQPPQGGFTGEPVTSQQVAPQTSVQPAPNGFDDFDDDQPF